MENMIDINKELLACAADNNLSGIKSIIENNTVDIMYKKCELLGYLLIHKRYEILKYLIHQNNKTINIDYKNLQFYGHKMIHLASSLSHNNTEFIHLLLNDEYAKPINNNPETITACFLTSCSSKELEKIKYLENLLPEQSKEVGGKALINASKGLNTEVVEFIVNSKKLNIRPNDVMYETILNLMFFFKNAEMFEYFYHHKIFENNNVDLEILLLKNIERLQQGDEGDENYADYCNQVERHVLTHHSLNFSSGSKKIIKFYPVYAELLEKRELFDKLNNNLKEGIIKKNSKI